MTCSKERGEIRVHSRSHLSNQFNINTKKEKGQWSHLFFSREEEWKRKWRMREGIFVTSSRGKESESKEGRIISLLVQRNKKKEKRRNRRQTNQFDSILMLLNWFDTVTWPVNMFGFQHHCFIGIHDRSLSKRNWSPAQPHQTSSLFSFCFRSNGSISRYK